VTGAVTATHTELNYTDGVTSAIQTQIDGVFPSQTGNAGKFLTTNASSVSWGVVEAFAAGTKMIFQQTSAPTGWTKSTADNDKAMRVVTGSVSSGGTHGLSSPPSIAHTHTGPSHTHTSAGHTHSGPSHTHSTPSHSHSHTLSAGAHTLSTSQMPAHTHTMTTFKGSFGNSGNGPSYTTVGTNQSSHSTNSTGGGSSHSHSLSGSISSGGSGTSGSASGTTGSTTPGATGASGTGATGSTAPTAFAPLYLDVIVATKD
jgi:hypothetical protein